MSTIYWIYEIFMEMDSLRYWKDLTWNSLHWIKYFLFELVLGTWPCHRWCSGIMNILSLFVIYFWMSCLVLSCLVLSCLFLSCLVLSCLILSFLVLSCLVLSFLVLSYIFLSLFSYLILSVKWSARLRRYIHCMVYPIVNNIVLQLNPLHFFLFTT